MLMRCGRTDGGALLISCSRPEEGRLLLLVDEESVDPLSVLGTAGPAAAALWSVLESTRS